MVTKIPARLEWNRPAAGRHDWSEVACGAPLWSKFTTWERILLAMGHHVEIKGTWWHVPSHVEQFTDAEIRAMVDAAQSKFNFVEQPEQPAQGTLF